MQMLLSTFFLFQISNIYSISWYIRKYVRDVQSRSSHFCGISNNRTKERWKQKLLGLDLATNCDKGIFQKFAFSIN